MRDIGRKIRLQHQRPRKKFRRILLHHRQGSLGYLTSLSRRIFDFEIFYQKSASGGRPSSTSPLWADLRLTTPHHDLTIDMPLFIPRPLSLQFRSCRLNRRLEIKIDIPNHDRSICKNRWISRCTMRPNGRTILWRKLARHHRSAGLHSRHGF